MTSMSRQKLIIDTDCGIDDSMALLLTLTSKERAEIVAITCCFGNTSVDNVCQNVKRVLTLCDEREIPIHRGSEGPIIKRKAPVPDHGSDGLGECSHEFSTGGLKESGIPSAVALINLAKKYPKEITILCIGPLTNLALAHRIDSSFTENLNSIVIMGGNYKGNVMEGAEFNFSCDPEAANIIVSEAVCFVVLVPWETTLEYGIEWGYYYELCKIKSRKAAFFSKITDLVAKRGQTKGDELLKDGDLLAAVAALYPEKVKSSFKRHLRVECTGELTLGMTVASQSCTERNRNPASIIIAYDMGFVKSTLKKMLSES